MIPQRLQEEQYIFFFSTEVVRVCIYLSDKTTETLKMNRKNNVDKTNFHSTDPHRKIKWFIKFFQCKESHLSSGCICKAKSLLIPQDTICYLRKYLCCNLFCYSQHKQKLWSALPALKPICCAYDKSYSFGSTNLHLQTAKSRGYDIAE